MYAGSLWLGGFDAEGRCTWLPKPLAALAQIISRVPLTTTPAQITWDECQEHDEIHHVKRQEVVRHLAHQQAVAEGVEAVQFPNGYVTPGSFLDWPAHGNLAAGQAFNLAPFIDVDGDGLYDPRAATVPGLTWTQAPLALRDLQTSCMGTRPIFCFNDAGNSHSESGGVP